MKSLHDSSLASTEQGCAVRAIFAFWQQNLRSGQTQADPCLRTLYGHAKDGPALSDIRALREAHVHPEDRDLLEQNIQQALANPGEPWDWGYRIRHVDGSTRYLRSRGRFERDAQGQPLIMVGMEEDVTDQVEQGKAQEVALHRLEQTERIGPIGHWVTHPATGDLIWSPMTYELSGFDSAGKPVTVRGALRDMSEQRVLLRQLAEHEFSYQDLIENQSLLIERYLPDSTIIFANRTFAHYMGIQPEAVCGKRWLDFLPAEQRERAQAHLAGFTPENPVSSFENSIPTQDGQSFWVLWTNRAFFDEHGTLTHFQSVGVDITERHRAEAAEQQLRRELQRRQSELEGIFAAATSVSLIKVDLDLIIQEVSPGTVALFGYSREALLGQHVSMLHTQDPVDATNEDLPIRVETELLRRDGSTFTACLTVHPVCDAQGKMVAALGVSFDISDQKRAERVLAEALETRTHFMNAVNHDLRTPLNTLMGFADLLADTDLTEGKRREYKHHCQQAGKKLLALVDSLLELSSLQAGGGHAVAETFNLHETIEWQFQNYHELARDRGLALEIFIDPAVPEWVTGDATKLDQLLSNLVSNAIKYTKEGRVDLKVHAQGQDDRVTFLVSDTGEGISPERQERIFNAFDRGGYEGEQKGFGLGLTIVRELIDLLGGEMDLDSTPGVGSTFKLTLPLPAVSVH
ncbi:PAS domain S-box-containing protein [Ectothiorhodospira magna]|uniref:histidine kinase n=1 Tax=Ectothiorhodospira magna TaxID=867345 RepID=A0A1H9C2G7_9GAMM|nr:PAS domain S-box protein [Ectothiorhodospira magna]SEP95161.1 PAS domain S-box-containing protein [Ectothiorhodospira magna]